MRKISAKKGKSELANGCCYLKSENRTETSS